MADDGWDYDEEDEAPAKKGDTVKLALALKSSASNRSLDSLSGLGRLSEGSLGFLPPPTESSGKEDEQEEEEEDEDEWIELRDELVSFFNSRGPSDDSQGLYAQQKEAFERSMSLVDCNVGMSEALAQTVRNLVELSTHLLSKCSATESELLSAAAKLEERRQRHEQVKAVSAERKRALAATQLRAERAEIQAQLYESQVQTLKTELTAATAQLEQMSKAAPDDQQLRAVTMRGKGATEVAQNALAALTAELEALNLSPEKNRRKVDDDSGFSSSNTSPRVPLSSSVSTYQQLVNELVLDNDLLQREYLELVTQTRAGKEPPPQMANNELALLKAAKARLEQTLRDALADKVLLEQALLKIVTGRK